MCWYFLRLDWFDLGKEAEMTWVFNATGKKITKHREWIRDEGNWEGG